MITNKYIMSRTFTYPEADISINGNRVKKYRGKRIFLPAGVEFQLELSNNTQLTYAARIKLNGQYIGKSSIVLYPGSHEYLTCNPDTKEKFIFETYKVPNTTSAKKAIEKNGLVEIEFHKEKTYNWNSWNNWNSWTTTDIAGDTSGGNATLYGADIRSIDYAAQCSDSDEPSSGIMATRCKMSKSALPKKSIETGRVGRGDQSNQRFQSVSMDFESFISHMVTYHLLPESEAAVEVSQIAMYCTECARRLKKGWRFCAGCGTKC